MAQIQELDLGGDISLLVGAEGSQQLRVRASKALLAYASDYFKTLFGPHFSERASAAAGKDIQLADDDPQAFGLLCKILHMRYRSEDPPTYDDLVALGVVADKYGCVQSLRLSLDFLFSRNVSDLSDASKATVASYLLDRPVLFMRYTRWMVLNSTSSFIEFAISDHGKVLPTLVWLKLESIRNTLTKTVANTLVELSQYPCSVVRDPCRGDVERWSQEVAQMLSVRELHATPFHHSLGAILSKTMFMRIPTPPSTNCSRTSTRSHRNCMSNEQFEARMQTIVSHEGLCLDCIRTEGQAKKENKCRIAHA